MKRSFSTSSLKYESFNRWRIFPVLILYIWVAATPASSFLIHHNQNNLEILSLAHSLPVRVWKSEQGYPNSRISSELKASLFQDALSTSLMANMPLRGRDGIYNILNEEQYRALIEYSEEQNTLVVLKVWAPWCKTCKRLGPKFVQLSRKEEYEGLPILWAELTCKDNKELIEHVLVDLPLSSSFADSPYPRKPKAAIPSVQLYDGGREIFTFACNPTKVPMLKTKLNDYFENEYECPQYSVEAEAMGKESNQVADAAPVVNWAPWTRSRLFPGGPSTVKTSSMANGQVDQFSSDALMTMSDAVSQNTNRVLDATNPQSSEWGLGIHHHQREDLSPPVNVSLDLEYTEEYQSNSEALAMQP